MSDGVNSEMLVKTMLDLHVRVIEHMMARQTEHDALVGRILGNLVDDRGVERREKQAAQAEGEYANAGWAQPVIPKLKNPPKNMVPPSPTNPFAGLHEEDSGGHGDIIANYLNANPTLPSIAPAGKPPE